MDGITDAPIPMRGEGWSNRHGLRCAKTGNQAEINNGKVKCNRELLT